MFQQCFKLCAVRRPRPLHRPTPSPSPARNSRSRPRPRPQLSFLPLVARWAQEQCGALCSSRGAGGGDGAAQGPPEDAGSGATGAGASGAAAGASGAAAGVGASGAGADGGSGAGGRAWWLRPHARREAAAPAPALEGGAAGGRPLLAASLQGGPSCGGMHGGGGCRSGSGAGGGGGRWLLPGWLGSRCQGRPLTVEREGAPAGGSVGLGSLAVPGASAPAHAPCSACPASSQLDLGAAAAVGHSRGAKLAALALALDGGGSGARGLGPGYVGGRACMCVVVVVVGGGRSRGVPCGPEGLALKQGLGWSTMQRAASNATFERTAVCRGRGRRAERGRPGRPEGGDRHPNRPRGGCMGGRQQNRCCSLCGGRAGVGWGHRLGWGGGARGGG
jgi:hypothetical protein